MSGKCHRVDGSYIATSAVKQWGHASSAVTLVAMTRSISLVLGKLACICG